MIIICGTIEVTEAGIAPYKAAAGPATEASLKEEGCGTYGFYQSIDNPCLFRVYEEWESKEHLRAHGASAHFAAFGAAIKDIVVARKITMIEPERMRDL
ncbi:putative quinol monooxygenase [Pseudooceanicola sp. C21-150M6]|uniref:putative quinol monooxygenase n=1 Tax=Pseudooceanicola sp. C21-150M6 TaxID=3434355 RepID=UPI003D7F4ECC